VRTTLSKVTCAIRFEQRRLIVVLASITHAVPRADLAVLGGGIVDHVDLECLSIAVRIAT